MFLRQATRMAFWIGKWLGLNSVAGRAGITAKKALFGVPSGVCGGHGSVPERDRSGDVPRNVFENERSRPGDFTPSRLIN